MEPTPKSILIVGSGVFGLSTAWALAKRPAFKDASITVVDNNAGQYPAEDCASCDSSRIIRADYADAYYTALALESQNEWRKQGDDELGGQGRYSESGLMLMAHEPSEEVKARGGKSGMDFARESWVNVVKFAEEHGFPPERIKTLQNGEELRECLKTESSPGDWGYLNTLSGWADATEGMAWLYRKVTALGRVEFVDADVRELMTREKRVMGVRLKDGRTLEADVVVVAAGAWTGSLVDLRGRVEASGHPLGYIEISDEEREVLAKQPVVLNLTTGLFVIPPRDNVLKVARHSFGYLNPMHVTNALPPSPASKRGNDSSITISQPSTLRNGGSLHFPAEADRDLRRALADLVPIKGLESRPWKQTRLCWYSDTRDGDWLVDWHPEWKGLFVATGDSGHGYKFLPVLGEKIVDCMEGKGGELGKKWKWEKHEPEDEVVGREVDGVYRGLITRDGSRGGAPGMILEEELRKS